MSQAGGVRLTETVRAVGLDRALSAALARWRHPNAVHDPAKVLLDLAVTLTVGGVAPAGAISPSVMRDWPSLPGESYRPEGHHPLLPGPYRSHRSGQLLQRPALRRSASTQSIASRCCTLSGATAMPCRGISCATRSSGRPRVSQFITGGSLMNAPIRPADRSSNASPMPS